MTTLTQIYNANVSTLHAQLNLRIRNINLMRINNIVKKIELLAQLTSSIII